MINYHKLHDLSCQYWQAIDRQDYEWSDYLDHCFERDGLERLTKEECEEPILDLSPLEKN
jgi:hypothetical protein